MLWKVKKRGRSWCSSHSKHNCAPSYLFGLKLLQIQNNLQLAVDILVKSKESPGSVLKLFTVEPGEAKNVPLYTAYKDELYVKPSNTR